MDAEWVMNGCSMDAPPNLILPSALEPTDIEFAVLTPNWVYKYTHKFRAELIFEALILLDKKLICFIVLCVIMVFRFVLFYLYSRLVD